MQIFQGESCCTCFAFSTVNGHWDVWLPWSSCSLTCDFGQSQRRRICKGVACNGRNCEGVSTEIAICYETCCPGNKLFYKYVYYYKALIYKKFSEVVGYTVTVGTSVVQFSNCE